MNCFICNIVILNMIEDFYPTCSKKCNDYFIKHFHYFTENENENKNRINNEINNLNNTFKLLSYNDNKSDEMIL